MRSRGLLEVVIPVAEVALLLVEVPSPPLPLLLPEEEGVEDRWM
jgi:hypothetical protein